MNQNSQKDAQFQIFPIGKVVANESGFQLQIDQAYRPALKQLDQFSHVMVLWWADRHDNTEHRGITQTELPYASGVKAGVFACRAEYRPNPIAVTSCPILDIDLEGGIVQLAYIDAFDGTPILDLKPYLPVSDRIRDVQVAEWFADWPEYMEDAAEFFAQVEVDVS